ncbi:EamA family transporter [Utexia brackfieldae]|uniref:DMT family transporter n=1 Tax=Utexia brackfieldae TaxID=3074108 RepID=UPI00370D56A4
MPFSSYCLALLVVIIWAYNNIAVKMGVGEIPPMFLITLRFLVVAILVVPFTRIKRDQIKTLVLLAFTFGFIHFAFLFTGLSYANAGISAILVQLGTPFAIIMACFLLKEPLKMKQIVGIVISFIGIVVLSGSPEMPSVKAIILLLISAMGWALTNIIVKKQATQIAPLTLTGWLSLFAIPIVGLASFIFESNQFESIQQATWKGWNAVLFSAIASSIVAYSIWYWLLRKYPINSVVPFSLLSPVFAVFFGAFMLGESLDGAKLVGALLVVAGIFFAIIDIKALLSKRRRAI